MKRLLFGTAILYAATALAVEHAFTTTGADLSESKEALKHGAPSDGYKVMPGYVAKPNGRTRCPDWVLWIVDGSGGASRAGVPWVNDADVPQVARQAAKDYEGQFLSGHENEHAAQLQLGHQKPAADSKQTARRMQACMALEDNICPQTSALNQHTWEHLEAHVRFLATEPKVTVYCVTGPLWMPDKKGMIRCQVIGETGTWVPTHFFKAVLVEHHGAKQPFEMYAWILPNTDSPPENFDDGRVTTDDVEKVAGIDLWSQLPPLVQSNLEGTLPAPLAQ